MRTADDFLKEILEAKSDIGQNVGLYGGNVMPVLEIYKKLGSYEERKAFQDALERMLCDKNKDVRSYAVDICLGFFVFRNAV
jgi:hypothetical protein